MSYLGSPPASQFFAPGTDTFSGDGTTVAFTLSRNVGTVNDILVVVNNVDQQPSAYTVSVSTLTFSAAPSAGTNNIYVRYLSTNLTAIVPQYGSVVPSSLSTPNALYWDTSGNVGIGTTSPSTKLNVVDAGTGAFTTLIQSGQTGTTPRSNSVLRLQTTATGRDVNIQFSDNVTNSSEIGMVGGAQYFATAGAERMRIDSIGNLLVGTTSSTNAAKVTAVSSSTSASYQMMMNNTDTGTGSQISMDIYRNSTRVGYITTTNTTTSFTSISDYRLKKDVVPMTNALAAVAQLKPCRYKWKVDGSDGQGFIAHELQAVVPDCVFGEKDSVNEDGSIKPQGIDTSFLVATLTAAIQEQQAMIEELKTKVAALEAR